jgi:predicted phosphodiesterase
MRVALVSDIHGNLFALEAVLADLRGDPAERIICLGDVFDGGPWPRACLARLREVGAGVVLGNADHWMLEGRPRNRRQGPTAWIDELGWWCAEQLSAADRESVRAFQTAIEIPMGPSVTLHCVHGSPRSMWDNMLATTPAGEIDAMLAGAGATLFAAGHTHEQLLRRIDERAIVNPGSVGAPFDRRALPGAFRVLPWAEYAVVEAREGALGIDLRRVPLDLAALTEATLASGMPYAREWLAERGINVP